MTRRTVDEQKDREPGDQRDRNDPVAASGLDTAGRRKLCPECRQIAVHPEADVVRKDRLQHRNDNESDAHAIAGEQAYRVKNPMTPVAAARNTDSITGTIRPPIAASSMIISSE